MNYARSLFLPIICASLCISAENIRLLQQDNINKKIVEIEKQVIRDRRIVVGLKTLAHVQEIFILWSLISPFFVDSAPVEQLKPLCEACKKIAEKPVPFTTSLWSGLSNFGHTTKNLFTTPQGWWTLGQCGLYYGSCLAALYVTLRMPDDFVHPDTLRWYVHTHTPYEATTQLMKEAIIHLRDKAPEQIKIDYHKQLLKDSFDRLVRYGEGICAYMTYKTKQLDEHERLVAERAARYFFVYYNAWLANVAAQYALDVPDYDALEKLITTYETEMGSQLCHFYAIEGETKRDKRAVRKRE